MPSKTIKDRIPTLPQHPARLLSRRAWARITDVTMVRFCLAHFNQHGDCTLSETELSKHRVMIEALITNGHARHGLSTLCGRTWCLIGEMLNIRSSHHMKHELGLEARQYQPWLTPYYNKRGYAWA